MSNLDLEAGSVAIVTGGGRGIGRAMAIALGKAGARLAIADANAANARAVAGEIGGGAVGMETDVTNEEAAQSLVADVLRRFGRIDILINNAAINMSTSSLSLKPFWEISLDEWNAVLGVNATGTFLCSRAVAPAMRARRFGRIINLTSTAVALGRPNYLHYIASKAAIIGMTRSMARELGADNITVNAISPGPVETEVPRKPVSVDQHARMLSMQCIADSVRPEDLVGAVLFLCSRSSRMITGQVTTIDGGAVHN